MTGFAIFVGKIFALIGKILGRGSSLPGYMARKVDPDFMNHLELPETVVMITGTNGKTSVTKYLAEFFHAHGKIPVTNHQGANITQGIATTLIQATKKRKVQGDVLVLEVDEGFLKEITDYIPPALLVVNNLFEDQVDRFGGAKALAEKMQQSVPQDTVLLVNGDDPMAVYFARGMSNRTLYFSLMAEEKEKGIIREESCPCCGEILHYDQQIYDHLGKFSCSCGFHGPEADYTAKLTSPGKFRLNDDVFQALESAPYMVYNALAAVAAGLFFGLDVDRIKTVLKTVTVGKGRLERFSFNGKDSFINLVKNPAGANLTLEMLLEEREPYQLLFSANNRPADGKDTSWLQSVAFEALKDTPIQRIFIGGEAADSVEKATNKALPDVPLEKGEVENLVEAMKNTGLKSYFLSNYTVLSTVKEAVEKYKD